MQPLRLDHTRCGMRLQDGLTRSAIPIASLILTHQTVRNAAMASSMIKSVDYRRPLAGRREEMHTDPGHSLISLSQLFSPSYAPIAPDLTLTRSAVFPTYIYTRFLHFLAPDSVSLKFIGRPLCPFSASSFSTCSKTTTNRPMGRLRQTGSLWTIIGRHLSSTCSLMHGICMVAWVELGRFFFFLPLISKDIICPSRIKNRIKQRNMMPIPSMLHHLITSMLVRLIIHS